MPAIEVDDLAQISARLAAAVREAGALALLDVRHAAEELDQGPDGCRRSARPTSPSTICCASGSTAATTASPGCRKKAPTIRRGLPPAMSGSSIRSTARAPISRACRIGRCRRRWSRTAGRSRPASTRRSPTNSSWPRAGAGATCNGAPIAATAGAELERRAIAGPRNLLERLAAVAPPFTAMPRVRSLALRLARVAQGACDAAFAGGNSHDWDLAAADLLVHEAGGALTPLRGGAVTYNRPVPRHGMLVAAGRDRHAALIELLGDGRLAFS